MFSRLAWGKKPDIRFAWVHQAQSMRNKNQVGRERGVLARVLRNELDFSGVVEKSENCSYN